MLAFPGPVRDLEPEQYGAFIIAHLELLDYVS